MILGIIRHFKVDFTPKRFLYSPGQFAEVMGEYDTLPVIPNSIKLIESEWNICYCSTLPRARETAEKIYNGKIIYTDLLKEIPISPVTYKKIKLPAFWWHIAARIAWYRNGDSQKEPRRVSIERINKLLDEIGNSGYNKILIVSHGFFMEVLFKELIKKGMNGTYELHPKNGKLYLFRS